MKADFRAGSAWGPIPGPPPGWTWEALMDRALELARSNADCEVPVGALVVDAHGRVLGEGVNAPIREHDPSAHAEIRALRDAGCALGNYRLGGCIMVVTLEPCLMCTGAILHARLAGLVYGAEDARAGSIVSRLHGLDLPLAGHTVWHMGAVRGVECAALLRDFFSSRR